MFRTSLVVAVVVAVVLLLYALKVLQDNHTRIVYFRVEGFPAVPSSPSTPLRLLVIGITVACKKLTLSSIAALALVVAGASTLCRVWAPHKDARGARKPVPYTQCLIAQNSTGQMTKCSIRC